VVDLSPRPRHALVLAGAVALRRALGDQLLEVRLLVHPRRRGERGQVGGDETQVEGQCERQLTGRVDDAGPAREAPTLLGVTAQVRERRRVQPALHLLEALARTDRREDVGARERVGRGVVHVVRRHQRDVVAHGELGQHVVARHVVGRPVVPELDRDVVTAEGPDEPFELTLRGARAILHQCARQWALATPAQHEPLVGPGRDLVEGEARGPLLAALQVRLAEHRGETAIAVGRAREHHEVLAGGIVHADAIVARVEGHLAAEDRRETEGPGGLGEAHDAVESVVVGQCETREAEPRALGGELLGVARAVEEAEAGVGVEFAVRGHQS
jgi:hypothetical protein